MAELTRTSILLLFSLLLLLPNTRTPSCATLSKHDGAVRRVGNPGERLEILQVAARLFPITSAPRSAQLASRSIHFSAYARLTLSQGRKLQTLFVLNSILSGFK
jgi:hypothetical protein